MADAAAKGAGARVLIAEDQADVSEALRLVLKQEGFETRAASSADAVLAALSSECFDLLLMDLNYTRDTTSGSEGLELLARVQQLDRFLPVIAMTAWGSIDLAVEAMRLGASDFIQKPWDNWRLVGMVRNQMERRHELRRAESDHDREMREAGELQKRMLPRHITQIPGIDIAVDWKPARLLGGDYYDVLRLADGTVGLCIADVEGKGVPAALVMSNLQAAVKAFAAPSFSPKMLCSRLNTIFCEDVAAERLITFFYARLDPATRRVTYCNAGHCAPLLLRRDGMRQRLDSGGAVLGHFPQWSYDDAEISLQSGDLLVLFTDGLTEAHDGDGQEFGEERLANLLGACARMTAASLQRRVLDAVSAHCGNRFHDDATLMVVGVQ
ncbi:MAG: fused response regulator/phosphatase [Acidobacteriales bacterium]|nr:fused response regulator/phosphatase [Terriglobales bacterium]